MSASLIKKISPKQLAGDVKKVVREQSKEGGLLATDGSQTSLYRVFGIADGMVTGETDFGPWIAFTGQFEAVNSAGEIFKASKCFLPEPCDQMIKHALEDNESVQFALEVFVKRRDDLQVGYEYIPKPIVEVTDNDPLQHLRAAALPAPTSKADAELAESDKIVPEAPKKGAAKK